MGKYDVLGTPLQVGSITVKNRFAVAPVTIGTHYRPEGGYNDTAIQYFAERAKGGFGLIMTGALVADHTVDSYSIIGDSMLLHPEAFQEAGIRMTSAVHQYGTKIFAQITMGLGRNYPNLPAPSPMPVFEHPEMLSPELTHEEIKSKIDSVVGAAKLAKESGFDGIEVHSIHWGYLLDQFAMSFFNHRTDEYGGTLENRLRAAREILDGIKRECGSDYPVAMRLGLQTFITGIMHGTLTGEGEVGRTLAEGIEICRLLESYGYDLLDVDAGTYDSFYYACPPMYMPKGFMEEMAAKAKAAVKIPVIVGGRMNDPDLAARMVSEGKADGITMGRQALADPAFPNKVLSGEIERIRPCLGCNLGCFNRLLAEGLGTSCAVNPIAAHESEHPLIPAETKKKICVIGGGVAGMETARTAAMRGHDVTILEKGAALGGHLLQAGAHEFKKEIADLNRWYQTELRLLGVNILLNQQIEPDNLPEGYDAYVLATGSVSSRPPIKGIDLPIAIDALDAIDHPKKIGQSAVVVGGGLVGCEIAYDLAKQGKKVTLVEALDSLMSAGMPAPTPNRQFLVESFERYNVEVLTSNKLKEVTDGGVIVENADGEKEIHADTVIMALGFKPAYRDLQDALDKEVYVIGDAKQAKTIYNAVWEGFAVAEKI